MPEEIEHFLRRARTLLARIVENGEDLLPAALIREYRAAWLEVPGQFDKVINDLRNVDTAALKRAGLTGPQLGLKLAGFDSAFGKLTGQFSLRWVKRALRWMNVILGSLATVISGAELIKEFKESIEIGIDSAEEAIGEAGW